jgi:hypothetical protein
MSSRIVAFSLIGCATMGCAAGIDAPGPSVSQHELTAFAPEQCLFGATKQELLASPALSVGPAVRYTAESTLPAAVAAQLASGIDGLGSAAALFDFVQDGELFQQSVTELASGRTFTLTTYWAGDNPHGFVQLGQGTQRVAKISDDSVEHCLVSPRAALTAAERCAFGDDVADLTLSDRFVASSTTTLTARSKLPALGELQIRALGSSVVQSAREVFAEVDGGAITRWFLTDRATGQRHALYTATRGGELFGLVFAYGTLDVLGELLPGQRGFAGCLAATSRDCAPDAAQLEEAPYSALLEEAMQSAYGECRYCTGLEVLAFEVLCPGDVADSVVSILNDRTQGRPGYAAAFEISAAEALSSFESSGIASLEAPFREALGGAADVRWFFSSGRYEPTAPGVDGAEKLVIAISAAASRAVSVTWRDEYP